jgi:hypothetical protein
MMNLALRSIFVDSCKRFLHALKSYDVGVRLYFPSEGRRAEVFFIAVKNPSPLPGFNPRTLGLIASTLTITSPKRLCNILIFTECIHPPALLQHSNVTAMPRSIAGKRFLKVITLMLSHYSECVLKWPKWDTLIET